MSTPDSNPTPPPPSSPFSFAEGQKLAGCYVLAERLATGDDTEVWLAQDEVLGKDVCLHFIPEAVRKDSGALSELRQELKRSRQLIHPNILRVYDLIEEPEWAAISTDAFEGESVAVLLGKQPAKRFAAADIPWLPQLAQTIEEAHKINVLHRDLIPANLFLTSAGKVFVANFGTSRVIQNALGRAANKESSHAAFASPQLLDGQPPSRLDDVYSIGAVLYTLLAGQPPFVGADLTSQVREGVKPETLAVLQKAELAVPAAWQSTIAACLEKTPEARPHSAAEVGRRLGSEAPRQGVAGGEQVKAPVETVVSRPEAESAAALVKADPEKAKPAVKAPAERKAPADFSPRLYPEESRFPATALAMAAGFIVLVALIYHFAAAKKPSPDETTASATPVPEKAELRVLSNPTPPPPVVTTSPKPAVNSFATPKTQAQTPPPAVAAADKALAEKAAALEKAKQEVLAAEKVHADLVKQQQQTEAAVADAEKLLDEKAKAMELLKKAADDASAQRKKLEDDQKAAEAAVAEAQKAALEKARLADEAKKATEDSIKKNQDKFTAQEKAQAEIEALKKTLADKQRQAADAAKAAADADAARQQHLAVVAKNEQEIAAAKNAAIEEQRKREADEVERRKIEQDLADMKKMFADKMAELEAKRKALENPGTPAVPSKQPEKPPALPLPAATPAVQPVALLPKAATPEPVKMVSIPATPALLPAATPAPAAAGPNTNSLGQKFVPVDDVDFCVWQTRVKDFEVFAKAVNLKSTSWKGPGFKQGPDHPVVNVSWQEAIAFCKWLTDKEHKEGYLPTHQFYRLPTDLEWSVAVGLPAETGKTPEARDMGVPDVYPWGTAWPPPAGAGNYTGEETGSDVAIKGYDDGFAWTSPVGSFAPNKFGLYDMGGNVWQWCMDNWNNDSKAKVLRGASWYNGALKLSLLSSCRVHAAPDSSTDNYGFRIVRASEMAKAGKK